MISLRATGLFLGTLILGGVLDHSIISCINYSGELSDATNSPLHSDTMLARAIDANDAGTSRAVADVTPGQENGKQERILSLLEILQLKSNHTLNEKARRLAQSLDLKGILNALRQIKNLPKTDARDSLFSNFISRLVEIDPHEAIRYVKTSKNDQGIINKAYASIASMWAENDSAAAIAWVKALQEGQAKNCALDSLINTLADKDPDAALKLVLSLPKLADRSYNYAESIFKKYSQSDPADAARRAASLPSGQFRLYAIDTTAYEWGNSDPQAALRWAKSLPTGTLQNAAISNIIAGITLNDPATASEYILKLTSGEAQSEIISNFALQWATKDPTAALAWVEKLPSGSIRFEATRGSLVKWAMNDPQKAADYVMQMQDQTHTIDYLASLTFWGSNDPVAALAWARAQVNPTVGNFYLPNLLGEWARNEPEKAAAEVNSIKNPEAQKQAIKHIADNWSVFEPEKAIIWLSEMPEGNSRDNALVEAIGNWSRSNPENASAWLNKFPAGDTRDSLVHNFVNNLSMSDPATAAPWATTVSDDKLRQSAVLHLLDSWVRSDKNAAQQWLASQPNLSPQEQKIYQQRIDAEK